MRETEAPAWWAGVEHLREDIERRDGVRRDREDLAARRAARQTASHGSALSHRPAAPRRRSGPARPPASRNIGPPPVPDRRTVVITGRTVPAPIAPRVIGSERRRPPRRPVERVGQRPDRMAMWALLMGILLILVAVGTADASVLVR